MTTIAFDGRFLAADKQSTSNSTIVENNAKKLFMPSKNDNWRLNGYKIVAFAVCGNKGCETEIKDALNIEGNGLTYKTELVEISDFGLMAITDDLRCFHANKEKDKKTAIICEIENKNYAMGSGSAFANSYLKINMSAQDAVFYASKLDIYSGGGVDVIDLFKLEDGIFKYEKVIIDR